MTLQENGTETERASQLTGWNRVVSYVSLGAVIVVTFIAVVTTHFYLDPFHGYSEANPVLRVISAVVGPVAVFVWSRNILKRLVSPVWLYCFTITLIVYFTLGVSFGF